jgi:GTPase SAR1 family protein/Asp-tRNA(Asn)/Glu-tRNA(Gln) amidotransferase C subunit
MHAVSDPVNERTSSESAGSIGDFNHIRERILKAAGDILALNPADRDSCLEAREKLETNTFNLVVVGQFKRGKTCLINALLGADILPVSVIPLTSIVTVLMYGEKLGIKVFFNDGKVREIPLEELPGYVTESGNPRNEKEVREVVVLYPSPYLKDGVRLVDTPGVGSVYSHNTDVAYRYLPKSDAALFLLSIDQPVSSAEIAFLSDVREYADRIFFLLNKIDYLSEDEVGRALSFSRETLEQVMGPEIRIFPVSAKLALNGTLEGASELIRASRLSAFSKVLDRFLLKEKGKVLLGSVARNLLKVLSRARLETELELQSLKTPVDEIREKIAAFEDKREMLLRERRNFDTLFNSEINRLIIKELDRGLTQLKSRFIPQMEVEFHQYREQKKELSLKELNDALEDFVREKIELQFMLWQEQENEKLSQAFDSICREFAGKINQVIDSLLDFSSQLFSVPFEPVEAESLWTSESTFSYKFREDAVGLDMLAASLTQVAPKYISGRFKRFRDWALRTANRIILGKRKRHMLEAIEMQAGRLRFDFVERLNKSSSNFRSEMFKKMESISDGIAQSIKRGMDLRAKGEMEAAQLESGLSARLSEMERIRSELRQGRESAENL